MSKAIAVIATPRAVLAGLGDLPWRLLAPYERVKAASLRSARARDAYVAAHHLVRRVAAALTGQRAEELVLQQHCTACGGPHGQPVIAGLEGLHVSLSHGDGIVAAIAGPSPVAIDAEEWHKLRVDELLSARVFTDLEKTRLNALHPEERVEAAARLWVHKECLVKLGRLTLDEFAQCELGALDIQERLQGMQPGLRHLGFGFVEWADRQCAATAAAASADGVRLSLHGL